MKLHLQGRYPALAESPITYFRPLYDQGCSDSPTQNYQQFAYETGLLIANEERPQPIARNFGVPFLESYTRNILGQNFEYSSNTYLPNKPMSQRIKVMADDVERQFTLILQQANFALKLDETLTHGIEISLMVYVRFVGSTTDFCFRTSWALEAIFNTLSACLVSNDIPFSNIIGCTTDGTAAMVGRRSGSISRIKTMAPHTIAIHCALHRENLMAKRLHPALGEVMQVAVQVVIHVKGKPKCNGMGMSQFLAEGIVCYVAVED